MTMPPLDEPVLRALLDRLIPADDFPGAWEAGCGEYIMRLLANDLAGQQAEVAAGLRALDGEARTLHQCGFAELDPARQDAVMAAAERGAVRGDWPVPAPAFIRLMAELAAEGYYSDPSSGGNRNGVSWRMIGYPGELQ
jgi:hypothetical protein